MAAKKMHAIPYAQFSTEMRSGKIIKIDDGFTKLLGYTEDDVKNGRVAPISETFDDLRAMLQEG